MSFFSFHSFQTPIETKIHNVFDGRLQLYTLLTRKGMVSWQSAYIPPPKSLMPKNKDFVLNKQNGTTSDIRISKDFANLHPQRMFYHFTHKH